MDGRMETTIKLHLKGLCPMKFRTGEAVGNPRGADYTKHIKDQTKFFVLKFTKLYMHQENALETSQATTSSLGRARQIVHKQTNYTATRATCELSFFNVRKTTDAQ